LGSSLGDTMTVIKDIVLILALSILVYLALFLATRNQTLEQRMAHYDCRLSEFVPDFPPEVRAECRRRVLEQLNRQREQQGH
jgi:hypothetical protein